MLNIQLMNEENKYIEQYRKAIFRLMDENDIEFVLFPLVNLIHQVIENEIKSLISEAYFDIKTSKELKIDNTHDLKALTEHNTLKKYYYGIEHFEKIFEKYKEDILYFYNILGQDTFLNSRYPIQRTKNEITIKNTKINVREFYRRWGSYSENYRMMIMIYMTYSFSNTITYFKNNGKSEEEINNYKIEVIKKTLESLDEKRN